MPGETGSRRLVLALAAMAAAVPLIPAALGRTVVDSPAALDIGNQWIGFAAFARDSYLAGRFPLWNPHDLCGSPFLAFAHTGSLYPPAVLAHLLLPSYPAAHALDLFLHLALAAAGAFVLLRRDGRSPAAAFAGATVYAFSGFVFANINFPPSLHSAAWLPWWYAGSFALLSRPRLRDAALSALGLAGMVYGGDLEMTVFGFLGLGFAAVLHWRERGLDRRCAAAVGLAAAAGLCLALPQLLPAAELQARSIRAVQTLSPQISPLFLLVPPVFMALPIPQPASLYPQNHGLDPWYLGALPLLLLTAALRSPQHRRPLWALPAAALYFLLFFVAPMSRVFSQVPVLGGMAVPYRMQPALWLFLLLAATRALDDWLSRPADGTAADLLPGGRRAGLALIILGLATAAIAIASREAVAVRVASGLVILAAGAAALAPRSRPAAFLAGHRLAVAVALILLDLYLFALASLPLTDPSALAPDPRAARVLTGTAGRERYLIYSIRGILDPGLPYHLGLRLDADTIDSFSRLPPADSARRLARLYPAILQRQGGYDQMALRDPQKLDRTRLGLLNELNVKWFVGRFAWPGNPGPLRLTPVAISPDGDPDPLFIYRNDAALPRAYHRRGGAVVPVATARPAPDEVDLGPLPADGGTVTLSESWYPGWRAFDGEGGEVRVLVDDLGRRSFSPPETGRVWMRFAPESFRVGLWSGLASLAATVFLALARVRRRSVSPASDPA